MSETIAAIATGQQPCAIGILRLSGEATKTILDAVFFPANGRLMSEQQPRTMVYGHLLDGEGRDGLLPWLSTEEGKLRESGFLPTGSSDYTEPLPPDDLCRLLLHRTDETRRALSVDGSEVTVLLRRLAVSGVRYEQRETEVNLSAEVTVQAVNGTVPTRAALETALRNDLLKQLEMLENTVMHSRRSDILGLAARAALAGFDADAIDLSRITFVPRFVLRDPRGLLA